MKKNHTLSRLTIYSFLFVAFLFLPIPTVIRNALGEPDLNVDKSIENYNVYHQFFMLGGLEALSSNLSVVFFGKIINDVYTNILKPYTLKAIKNLAFRVMYLINYNMLPMFNFWFDNLVENVIDKKITTEGGNDRCFQKVKRSFINICVTQWMKSRKPYENINDVLERSLIFFKEEFLEVAEKFDKNSRKRYDELLENQTLLLLNKQLNFKNVEDEKLYNNTKVW